MSQWPHCQRPNRLPISLNTLPLLGEISDYSKYSYVLSLYFRTLCGLISVEAGSPKNGVYVKKNSRSEVEPTKVVRYDDEFKSHAVRLKSITRLRQQIAVGVTDQILLDWHRDFAPPLRLAARTVLPSN